MNERNTRTGESDKRLGALLSGVLDSVRLQGVGMEALESTWREVCGNEIASYTRVRSYRGGLLRVEVANAPLLGELSTFMQAELERRLRGRLKGFRALRFSAAAWDRSDETNSDKG